MGTRGQGRDFRQAWSAVIRATGRDLRVWMLGDGRGDLGPELPVCRNRPQARPSKESVAFHLHS